MRLVRQASALLLVLGSALEAQIVRPPAAGTPPIQGPGTLVGIIVTPTGRPIDSAIVAMVDPRREIRSGFDGQFKFTKVPTGEFDIVVRKIGFVMQRTRIKVDPGGGSIRVVLPPVVQTLPPSVTEAEQEGLWGTVGDTAYNAVPGALVSVVGSGAGGITTDSLGKFYLPVKPGSYPVRVTKKGFMTQLASVTVPEKGGKRMVILLTPGTSATAAREAFALDNLRQRRVYAFGPMQKILTREDIARLGYDRIEQFAQSVAARRVDENCTVSIDGLATESVPMWSVDMADVEFLEVYSTSTIFAVPGNRAPAGRTSINGNSAIRTQSLAPRVMSARQQGCPSVVAWMRK
jgi:hypothetical protein